MGWAVPKPPRPRHSRLLEAVEVAAGEVGRKPGAEERLAELLADLDGRDPESSRSVIALVGRAPRVVARLDEHARDYYQARPAFDRLASRLGRAPDLIAVALAASHRDGRIRERAVDELLGRPGPELMPFLVLRTGDWVAQVRDRARAGLALLVADDPGVYLPAALPMTLLLEPRRRGGFASTQMAAALAAAPDSVFAQVAEGVDIRCRRFAVDLGLAGRRYRLKELVAIVGSEAAPGLRTRVAEAACREAVWTGQVETLRHLAGSPRDGVRALALTGLARMGWDSEVAERIHDGSPLVRAIARAACHRSGVDAPQRYRAAVSGSRPEPGSIAGLAETGSAADVPLLRGLLDSPDPKVRVQALRAMRGLDGTDVERAISLLRDPSPAVVKEATRALRHREERFPRTLPWELLADDRVELRRAGYRLLSSAPVVPRLRAALILAGDRDARLVRRGVEGVRRLVRVRFVPRRSAPPPAVTDDERAELGELARRARSALGDDTGRALRAWLERTGP